MRNPLLLLVLVLVFGILLALVLPLTTLAFTEKPEVDILTYTFDAGYWLGYRVMSSVPDSCEDSACLFSPKGQITLWRGGEGGKNYIFIYKIGSICLVASDRLDRCHYDD